jgi:hypothetical protein
VFQRERNGFTTNSIQFHCILQVFREQYTTAGLFSGSQDKCIPERKSVKPVEVDGGQDVGNLGSGNIELGEQFDFAARNARINAQFTCDRNEILLQHLQRHDAGARPAVLCYKVDGASLLRRCGLIVRVDEGSRHKFAPGARRSG